jgi:hypothetical protein
MRCLDKTISLLESGEAGRGSNRDKAIASLEAVSGKCDEAIKVWQEYLKAPGAPGDRWSVLSWVGPVRAKRLHELSLEANQLMVDACLALAPERGHTALLGNGAVVLAYGQLAEGESGPDAARAAVQRMQQNQGVLKQSISRIKAARTAPAKKTSASTASPVKKAPVKKPVTKKAPAKKAAPAAKKPAPKQAAAPKKAVKKSPAKKKPAAAKKPAKPAKKAAPKKK